MKSKLVSNAKDSTNNLILEQKADDVVKDKSYRYIMTGINKDKVYYYSVRYIDQKGKIKQKTGKSKRWKSYKEAKAAAEAFLETVSYDDKDITMDRLYNLYYKYSKDRIKESTQISYKNLYQSKIQPYFGTTPIHNIKPIHIAQWQVKMLEKGLENSTITTIQTVFRLYFNYAVRNDIIEASPFKAHTVTNKNKHKREMLFWTPDEFTRFIQCVDKPILKVYFKLLYWTGIRRGEAAALTIGDIDFKNNVIKISKTYDPRTQVVTAPKSYSSNREVEMTAELSRDLSAMITRLLTAPDIGENDYLFYGSHRISPSTFELARDKACMESGVKRIRLHDIRHSHVSLLINNRFTPFEISKRLGHSIEMVEKVYSHMFKDGQRAMVTRLNEIAQEITEKDNASPTKNGAS